MLVIPERSEAADLTIHTADLNLHFLDYLPGEVVGIALNIDHPFDSRIDDHLGAQDTGKVRGVKSGPFDAHPEGRRLDDGILLPVDAPTELVTLPLRNFEPLPQATHLLAVP